ncbi:hypothetical protein Neosp_006692 [[Neocosmospora] mangrovei]
MELKSKFGDLTGVRKDDFQIIEHDRDAREMGLGVFGEFTEQLGRDPDLFGSDNQMCVRGFGEGIAKPYEMECNLVCPLCLE